MSNKTDIVQSSPSEIPQQGEKETQPRKIIGTYSTVAPNIVRKPGQILSRISEWWNNLNVRNKFSVVLIGGIALPVISVTQGMVFVAQRQAQQDFQSKLKVELTILEEEIKSHETIIAEESEKLAQLIEATGININDPAQMRTMQTLLNRVIQNNPDKSFYMITDLHGRTLAQKIQVIDDDFQNYPPLVSENTSEKPKLRPVSRPLGINLKDVPIVNQVLSSGEATKGVELLKSQSLQRLGIPEQAAIGIRSQEIETLPEAKQPFPLGTFDIDEGKAGLVIMSVTPIKIDERVVGTAIVGNLLNRNYEIVDKVKETAGVSTATIFAKDWRVSTNVPYEKGENPTRAIGTRVSREVADTVLNKKETFLGKTNIVGQEYLTGYSPIYDHQQQPVGIAYVGEPISVINRNLWNLALAGYGIGGTILLIAVAASVPIANYFAQPLQELAVFVRRVGKGEKGMRLENTPRQDEIGILVTEVNQMVSTIEANLQARQQEAEQVKLLAEISRARQEKDIEAPLNILLEKIRNSLLVDRVVIYRFKEKGGGFISAEAVDSQFVSALTYEVEDDCIREELIEAYKQGRVVPTDDVFEAGFHPEHLQLMEKLSIKANLVVPLLKGEELYGLLIAHHCRDSHNWQPSEIHYLKQIAGQLSISLASVGFLEQQQKEAERERREKEEIQNELLQLLSDVEGASEGNLTVRADISAGSIGIVADFFNAIIENLRDIVTQVKQTTSQVNLALGEDQTAMEELASQSRQQAEKTQKMLDFVEKMAASIQEVAHNAQAAATAAKEASLKAESGEMAMDATVDTILTLRSTVAETAKKVKRLGESSQQIAKVISLINEIALKTNLLAVNASIEAARAGEEGRGFAVVAEEVGQLAAQSATATKEIENIVEMIQRGTSEVVEAMEIGTSQVVEGTNKVEQAKQSLEIIVAESRQIDELVQKISEATVSQSKTSEMVTNLMADIFDISESASISSQQVSSSLQETVVIAGQLQASVETFKVED